MTNYQHLIIGGGMTAAAAGDGIRTPAALVREIKKHLGLSIRDRQPLTGRLLLSLACQQSSGKRKRK